MANTLTGIIPTLYAALDTVSREMVGFSRAVRLNPSDGLSTQSPVARAALNETVTVPVWPQPTAADTTAAVTPPDTGDQTVGTTSISISKSRHVAVRWNGEETQTLQNNATFDSSNRDRIMQAYRTLVNEMEDDLAGLYVNASRAVGTAGTTPFATANNMTDLTGAGKILDQNGAPSGDRHVVLDAAAVANLKGLQPGLFHINEAGSAELLRNGTLTMPLFGMQVHQSGSVDLHTKGTGTNYLLNDAGSAAGDTTITVDTGSGTIIAGDVITFAGTTDQYVVKTALAANDVIIQNPGLLVGETNNDAITLSANYRANMVFHRDAIVLLTRQPALPQQGDIAIDRTTVVDPVSGIAFEAALYPGFRQMTLHIALAWGYAAIKPEHIAILKG